jgi:alanyl-tRNA synthetase
MAIPEDVISSLEEKTKRIIQIAETLKVDNERLQQRVDELLRQLRTKSQEIEVLESKYQSLKLTKTLLAPSPEDAKSVKLQVNRMVREIDKCIALLNR